MPSDFSSDRIKKCVQDYPKLYSMDKNGDDIVIRRGGTKT